MNAHSKFDQQGPQSSHKEKQYMWLGYGDYGNWGCAPGRMIDGGMLRCPKSIDTIMEALGLKKKEADPLEARR